MKFGLTMPTATGVILKDGMERGTFGVKDMSCPTWRQVTQAPWICVTSDMIRLRNHIWFVPSVTIGV